MFYKNARIFTSDFQFHNGAFEVKDGCFGEILPDYDRDRVYITDVRKFFSWYNTLLAAGFTKFVDDKPEEADEADAKEEAGV